MKRKVMCDNCRKDFVIEKIAEKHYMKDGEKWRELWFNCPHCGHRYNVYNGVDKVKGE